MKIAIDAREAAGAPTGVGRYLTNLLEVWHCTDTARPQQFSLYVDDRPLAGIDGSRQISDVTRLPRWPEFVPGRDTLWQQLTLPRRLYRDRPDIFFSPAYSLPFRLPCPSVVTVHDISFEAHPEWFPRRQGMRRRYTCRRACRSADLVLTISEFSRNELIDRYHLPPERVVAVPLAADRRFQAVQDPAPAQRILRKYGIRGRVILHAGTILNRRMIPLLLEAFAQVLKADPDLTLVFAGENRSWPEIDLFRLAAGYAVDDRVIAPGYVSDEDLAILYNAAALTVYLSEYEGFGLPPLEALTSGCPVITSGTGALKEQFEDLACLFSGSQPGALAQLILDQLTLTASEPWKKRMERGLRAGDRFSWDRTAADTLSLILDTAGPAKREKD